MASGCHLVVGAFALKVTKWLARAFARKILEEGSRSEVFGEEGCIPLCLVLLLQRAIAKLLSCLYLDVKVVARMINEASQEFK